MQDEIPYNRSGHTVVPTQNGMIIFGGDAYVFGGSVTLYFNDVWQWKYHYSQFTPVVVTRGTAGRNAAIAYGLAWTSVFIIVGIIYFPKKWEHLKNYSLDAQEIEDRDIFLSKSRKRKNRSVKHHSNVELVNLSSVNRCEIEKLPGILY